jgi:hypothetical protein
MQTLKMNHRVHKNLRRRNEDVEYWRKRAGWFDDDVSMKEFNSGVYDTYYQLDDDGKASSSKGTNSATTRISDTKGLATFLKIGAALVAIGFAVLLYRALSRRSSTSRKTGSSSKQPAESKARARSRSRSSRSRSRSRRATSGSGATAATNYELMDEKSETRSRKSSRSRSRSRRQSKSGNSGKSRSRSKGRQTKEVLV